MGDKKGTWYLESNKTELFFSEYAKALRANKKVSLAEKPGEYVPLLVDIDIKQEIDGDPLYGSEDKLYNIEDVVKLVEVYQGVIKRNIQTKLLNRHLWALLLEKPLSVSDRTQGKTTLKNGFHLHFPHIFLSKHAIKHTLLSQVREEVDNLGLFANITDKPSTLIDDVSSKCWLLYGSSKEGNNKPYKVTRVYNHNREEISLASCFKKELQGCPDEEVEDRLPQLLTIIPDIATLSKKTLELKAPEQPPPARAQPVTVGDDTPPLTDREIERMRALVRLLNPERADDYHQWLTVVGFTLYSIGARGKCLDEALESWKEFSEQSDKYDEAECDVKWQEMVTKNRPATRSMGSLVYLAKQDQPEKTSEHLTSEQIGVHLNAIGNLNPMKLKIPTTDTEIAELFQQQFGGVYLFGRDGWFLFTGTVWKNLEEGSRYISKNIVWISRNFQPLEPALKELAFPKEEEDEGYETTSPSGDDDAPNTQFVKIAKAKLRDIEYLRKKCENFSSQRAIIKTIENLLGEDDLDKKMNCHPRLIAFTNGVFELGCNDGTFLFRAGMPCDYLSKQLRVKYNTELSMEHPKVIRMLEFFKQIFPDEELRTYFFLQMCEIFIGGNKDKIVMIWTGSGDNGKSALQHIFEQSLGPLATKFTRATLSGDNSKSSGNKPEPELARTQGGVRWCVADELAPDEPLNAGTIKGLSGGDTKLARELFQRGKECAEFQPLFKLLLVCNKIPPLRNADVTTLKRIRVIPFETTFLDPKDYAKVSEEEKKSGRIALGNRDFSEKKNLLQLGEATMWYLMQVLIEKTKNKTEVHVPRKVTEATDLYIAQGDAISDYFGDRFEIVDTKNSVHIPTMYQDFKLWYPEAYANRTVSMNKKDFVEKLTLHCKKKGLLVNGANCCIGIVHKAEHGSGPEMF